MQVEIKSYTEIKGIIESAIHEIQRSTNNFLFSLDQIGNEVDKYNRKTNMYESLDEISLNVDRLRHLIKIRDKFVEQLENEKLQNYLLASGKQKYEPQSFC